MRLQQHIEQSATREQECVRSNLQMDSVAGRQRNSACIRTAERQRNITAAQQRLSPKWRQHL
ncbi:single-stranded-DNA-specific exonuclease RecJ [Sesbania bispinosa]|nr:single-stranded-DNA-specific exonuclease RecJ [Sesbania bispinosa]